MADIEFLRRRVRSVRAHSEGVKGCMRVDTPKTHRSRTAPRMLFLVARLAALAEGKDRDALLFTASNGSPLRSSNFHRNVWAPARVQAGQPGLRIHDLRRTAASFAVASGAKVKAVQKTLDRYAGLFDGHLDEVAAPMEARSKR